MTANAPDSQLVTAYATEGSETAFRSLVARHVNLVFATALRQACDAGMAEEITQNVFVALARKAPRLCGVETLAGWLHRTTILEARARVRMELRRQRREETAAVLSSLQREGASPLDALVPLLDEALLHLRDADRLALLLRFFQELSLREVGAALGVEEDAARKRVSRALERLAGVFRKRGLAVPAGVGCAGLFAHAAHAAPASLAPAAAGAGLAAGGTTNGINLLLAHLMALTKTQTAAICLVVAVLPLAWQWREGSRLQRAQVQTADRLAVLGREQAALDTQMLGARAALTAMQAERAEADSRRAVEESRRATQPGPPRYAWSDSAALVRVPKELLRRLGFKSLATINGDLSGQIRDVLQLTDEEARNAQEAVQQLLTGFRAREAAGLKAVEPTRQELGRRAPEEVRVFEVPDLSDAFGELRATAHTALREALGPERAELFEKGLSGWIPLTDEYNGTRSDQILFPTAKRLCFYRPGSGSHDLQWNIRVWFQGGAASMGVSYNPPEPYRQHVADWLELEKQLWQERERRVPRAAIPGGPPQ